ncbi:NTP pyrophosphohydrolase [Labilithrix luteola]|uniref:NTP pyrophosphohydrolase n=1 Tax=Labilithrix luteola TaxID=1391654 RepID=A0A0K1QES2_9BACT|nr:NUDIX domain-containing protein [Labilithrix luteola]AKV04172.1 NTP pyrophosphohydrolase [Labilithrix luteola]
MAIAIDKLAWLCIENRKVLGARSRGKELFYLPGGKREAGESDEAALLREIREELSVDLVAGSLRHVHDFQAQADGKPQGTLVKMTCYRADFRGTITPAAEIEEVAWLGLADASRMSLVTRIIVDWLAANDLVD